MTPSDFGDPRVPIDPSTLRVNPTGLAVAFESPDSGLIAVLPPLGQTPEEYIRLRTAAEVRRFRRVRLALLLSAASVLSVILAAFAFGPGSAAHPYALSGIGACALALVLSIWSCRRFSMPEHDAVIPRDLIDSLNERDAARIRVASREGRQDEAVAELVRRRVMGFRSGDTTTSLPVVAAA